MNFYSNYFFRFILIMTLSVPLLAVQAALPDFTRIVDQAKDSVVNISTKTKARKSRSIEGPSIPDFPEGSPFGELFEKFFDHSSMW